MEKVIFTKEEAWSFREFMKNRDKEEALNDIYLYKDRIKVFNSLSYSDLVRAIIYGYETEMTPEEKILKAYKEPIENELERGFNYGIDFTLKQLGIKIKGIKE